ncbi:MAG: 16S rRNA (uracil(1498)-N(3))-methyltransferase [Bacteroidaceae bacterium]|nr:16S rRNA (uracil(1498)-N(3))-methyltransferase [Bacteroidaceae bacterium]
MKEERYFYQPDIELGELTKEDTQHAVRVLRMKEGDELWLMDGRGTFFRAEITLAANHRCTYRILERVPQERAWLGHLHLAMAPTKLNDRTEWMAEKATEIGFDQLSFLDCQFSERRVLKTERIEKIVVSAMKQSRKAWNPLVEEMVPFRDFVTSERTGQKFICHCYEDSPAQSSECTVQSWGAKPFLLNVLQRGEDATVMIGPEGDFSVEEVRLAESHGWKSVSLGRSRLRTETAALVAVHLMHICNQIE